MSDDKVAGGDSLSRSQLSKEERRALLARIEREASRSRAESYERILQRAEEAFQNGNHEQAKRLALQLEKTNPQLQGLQGLQDRLASNEQSKRQQGNVKKAEEMLLRYVQERRKPMAQLALETLEEVAPHHPRLEEYKIWVRDLDQEAAHVSRLDELLAAGRTAVQMGDLQAAGQHLAELRQLDAHAAATENLAADIRQAEAGREVSEAIANRKQRFEELLERFAIEEAEQELAQISAQGQLPKVTLDQMRQRIDQARVGRRGQRELGQMEAQFNELLASANWPAARDLAQRVGQLFPDHPRASQMFTEVNDREAEQRRRESARQGAQQLEQFIAAGRKQEAQLALKLLRGKIADADLARYEARVNAL